jgi:hypothetical protein
LTNQIPQNDPVDVAFDLSGAVVQAQPVGDRVQVTAQTRHQRLQRGQVVGGDRVQPGGQLIFAGTLAHHGGEAGHMPGGGLQLRAAGQDLLQPHLITVR